MSETTSGESHRRTILLVEDEALIALAEAMTLERHGYRVIHASTGEQAVDLAESDPEIGLALMDINLGPGIDGTQAAQMILAARELPIVFLSSHTEPEVVERTEKITSYGYIVKNSGETVLTTSVKMAFRLFDSRKLTDDTFRYSMNGLCVHRMLYNAAGEPFDCEYLKVNDAFELHTGLPAQMVVGRTIRELYPEQTRELVDIYSGVVSSGKPIRRELFFAPTDRWFELSVFPTRENEFTVVVQDVTARKHSEQIIAEEKEWLNVTLQSVGDAVIATDIDGNVAVMNAVAERLTGWKEDGAQGRPLPEVLRIVSSVTGRVCENPVARVIRDGEVVGLANHTVLVAADGSRHQIADSAAPIRDARGAIIGVVLVFRDVSEEYRVAQALSDSERDMARAQAMAKLGSWRLELDSGTVFGSDEARGIFGVLDGELTLEYVQSLALAEYRPKLDAALDALVHNGLPYDVEFSMRRPSDNAVRCIRSIAEYDADHRRVVGTIQDITERKQMEEALRESELHFRTLADSGQALIWTSGRDKACNYFNQPWLEFTGRTLDQELGNGWVEGVHPDDRSRCIEIYVAAFDRREPFSMRYRLRRANGQYRWIQDDGTARYDSHGEFLGYIGHCLDITDLIDAEEASRNDHARFEMIAEMSPVGITTVDEAGDITFANVAAERSLGLERSEITSRTYNESSWESTDLDGRPLPDESHPFFLVKSTRRPVQGIEQSIVRPDGERSDLSINASPLFDHDGEFRGMVATIEDITDRRRAEKLLREANHRLTAIIDSIDAIVYVCDIATHETLFVNERARRLFGDVAGQKCWKAIQGQDGPCSFCSNDRLVDEAGGPTGAVAWDHYNAVAGRWFECRDCAVQWLDERTVRVEVAVDITDRKKAEANAHELQERLQKIIDNSPLLITEVDLSGHYVMVNQATCTLFSTTKEELVGRHFQEVLPPETASVFRERVDHIAETGEEMIVDDTLQVDQQERLFRSVLFPMRHCGESPRSIVGMAYEITTEKRLLAEKETLLKELNHRVRNNLAMVSSLINLKRSEMDIDLSDLQDQIGAIRLIHQDLDQAKGVTEVFCREYFSDLLSSIFSSFSSRRVIVDMDVDEIHIATRVAMPLGLIVNEIATNAIKHGFTDDGEARFSMKMKEDRANGRYEVVLSNTGKPFPQEIGLDNPQTLGLRLVSALTTQLDGTIDLQRAPQPVFAIRFPADGGAHRRA